MNLKDYINVSLKDKSFTRKKSYTVTDGRPGWMSEWRTYRFIEYFGSLNKPCLTISTVWVSNIVSNSAAVRRHVYERRGLLRKEFLYKYRIKFGKQVWSSNYVTTRDEVRGRSVFWRLIAGPKSRGIWLTKGEIRGICHNQRQNQGRYKLKRLMSQSGEYIRNRGEIREICKSEAKSEDFFNKKWTQ